MKGICGGGQKNPHPAQDIVISIARLQLTPVDGDATIKSESTTAIHATHATRQLRVIPFRATRDAKMPPDRQGNLLPARWRYHLRVQSQ